MTVTLGAAARAVIGARLQLRYTPGLSCGSTHAPMPRPRARPIVGDVYKRARWILPFLALVLALMIVTSALQSEPEPALHGNGLIVLGVLVVFVGLLAYGIVYRTRHVDPSARPWMIAAIAGCALVLAVVQPDGAGVLALYITLGVACARLEPRSAIPLFTVGIVVVSALHELIARDGTLADTIIADTSAIVFFFLGYMARQFRLGQARAEQLVEELEASRDAQAQAVTLRERQHLAREMHDVLAHSLSALAVQLEGARLLARSTGADQSVVEAVERSHHLAKGGLEEARRAIEALRGGDMPGPDRLGALADEFREQTGVDTALAFDGEPRELSSEARLAVYRTAQEALTNVRRHADAERVDLRLRYADDGTWLTVEDRGARANGAHEPGLGYGLTGMRERAELLGGRLAAAPTRDGFRVELYIPA
jgi:signal transduction histidine kinase